MKELGQDWISTNRKGKYWIHIMNRPESKQMSIYVSWQHGFSESSQITVHHIWRLSCRAYSHHALQILTNLNTWHCWGFPLSNCGDFKEFPQLDATAAAAVCCTHSLLWLKSIMTSRWRTWLLIKPSHLQKYTGWWFKARGCKLAFAQSLLNTHWKIKLYISFEHVHVWKEADAVGRHKHRLYVAREMMMMMMMALNRAACLGNSMATDFCTKLGDLLHIQMLLFSYQN